MIIDDDNRFIVIEGLGGPGQGMHEMHRDISSCLTSDSSNSSSSSSSGSFKMLCDPEILFTSRLYSSFGYLISIFRLVCVCVCVCACVCACVVRHCGAA